ncbi:MAG: inorganic diphosphatase [Gemmatimonadota bacterium]
MPAYRAPQRIRHPWHGVDPAYDGETVTAVVEIPRGGNQKFEVDKPTGLLRLSRVLFSAFVYPFNYGFIPRTFALDNDPLDILIVGDAARPLTLMTARIVGMLRMVDEGDEDDKILAAPVHDPRWDEVRSLKDMPAHRLTELHHFFTHYKELEEKQTRVSEWLDRETACAEVQASLDRYDARYTDGTDGGAAAP